MPRLLFSVVMLAIMIIIVDHLGIMSQQDILGMFEKLISEIRPFVIDIINKFNR